MSCVYVCSFLCTGLLVPKAWENCGFVLDFTLWISLLPSVGCLKLPSTCFSIEKNHLWHIIFIDDKMHHYILFSFFYKLFSFYFSGDGTLSVCNLRSNKVPYLVLSLFILAFSCMQSEVWWSLHLIFCMQLFLYRLWWPMHLFLKSWIDFLYVNSRSKLDQSSQKMSCFQQWSWR